MHLYENYFPIYFIAIILFAAILSEVKEKVEVIYESYDKIEWYRFIFGIYHSRRKERPYLVFYGKGNTYGKTRNPKKHNS